MTAPDPSRPDGPIADTQMFRKFVDEPEPAGIATHRGVWIWVVAVASIIVVGVIVSLILR